MEQPETVNEKIQNIFCSNEIFYVFNFFFIPKDFSMFNNKKLINNLSKKRKKKNCIKNKNSNIFLFYEATFYN